MPPLATTEPNAWDVPAVHVVPPSVLRKFPFVPVATSVFPTAASDAIDLFANAAPPGAHVPPSSVVRWMPLRFPWVPAIRAPFAERSDRTLAFRLPRLNVTHVAPPSVLRKVPPFVVA